MAEISLFRIDFRLIHGQVIVKWLKQTPTDRIVIIDDQLAKDDFMADIYRMSAPPGMKVEVYSREAAVAAWKKDQMGQGRLFVLVKTVHTTLTLKQEGFGIREVQVGGLGGDSGRVTICPGVTLDERDAGELQELEKLGCSVYLHVVPAEPRLELREAIERFATKKK